MNYQIIIDDYIGDWWLDTDKASIRRKLESYKEFGDVTRIVIARRIPGKKTSIP